MRDKANLPSVFKNPFSYFLIWTGANFLLSHGSLPLLAWIWVLFLGILLPAFVFGATLWDPSGGKEPFFKKEYFGGSPWPLVSVLLAGACVRLYRLTDLSLWPNRDDGIMALDPMEWASHWKPQFFSTPGEMGPFFPWLAAFYFKWVTPSLTSLWLFPALISLAVVPLGYWAARKYFSRSVSLLCVVYLSLGFWPCYLGRFFIERNLSLLWEVLTLGLMGSWIKSRKGLDLALLGASLGAGFYIFLPIWIPVALGVSVGVVFLLFSGKQSVKEPRWPFVLGFVVVLLPFVMAAIHQGYGKYVLAMESGQSSFSWTRRWDICFSYLREILWSGSQGGFHYGALWGGLLNPVGDSLLMLGAFRLYQDRRQPTSRWTIAVFPLLLLPGLASPSVEMMRVIIVIPILAVVTAMGAAWLWTVSPRSWTKAAVLLFLALSAGLDLYHLAGPYSRAAWDEQGDYFQSFKSGESFHAFQVLREKSRQSGPGYLFLDFVSVPLDQTLNIAAYPFDAVANPSLKDSQPRWMAFVTNVNYRSYLAKRFPEGQWTVLGSRLTPWDGELMLGVVPLAAGDRGTVEQWLEVQPYFHRFTCDLYNQTESKAKDGLLATLQEAYPHLGGDLFLESSYWEVRYFNHSADGEFVESLNDLTQVLGKGYPAAHIYNELGSLLYFKKDFPNAQRAFLKAVQLGGDHTLARENLRVLNGSSN